MTLVKYDAVPLDALAGVGLRPVVALQRLVRGHHLVHSTAQRQHDARRSTAQHSMWQPALARTVWVWAANESNHVHGARCTVNRTLPGREQAGPCRPTAPKGGRPALHSCAPAPRLALAACERRCTQHRMDGKRQAAAAAAAPHDCSPASRAPYHVKLCKALGVADALAAMVLVDAHAPDGLAGRLVGPLPHLKGKGGGGRHRHTCCRAQRI